LIERISDTMKGNATLTPTPVRLPDDLRLYLKHAAVDNRRSLTNEIAMRLEESRRRDVAAGAGQGSCDDRRAA
jgi:hypothetical protein